MDDYAELVKALRTGYCDHRLLNQAADAIEELTLTAQSYKRGMETWADEAKRIDELSKKKVYWVLEPDRYFHWHCSGCGYVIGAMKMDCKFCPNCGGKVEEIDG